jgi:predicted NAD/FAD-dependent oxidoreductase
VKVGIVGAGMCGLAAARTLRAAGADCVLFEKNKRVGGRIATFSQDGFVWDTGATSIAPRGRSIGKVIADELDTSALVTIEKPVYLHQSLRPMPGGKQANTVRYTYSTGNATLPKLLADGLDVRLDTQVEAIERVGDAFEMLGERFDAVILTPPIPRASQLLWSLQESRPLASVFYRSCINVALGFDRPLPDVPYHALLDPEQRHPMTWLSLESIKSPGRTPEGGGALCLQFSPGFSLDSYQHPDETLISTASFFVAKVLGPDYAQHASATVKRWKYSQPESFSSIEDANPPGTRVLIASDALLGGHTEEAFEVGRLVAERLLTDAH